MCTPILCKMVYRRIFASIAYVPYPSPPGAQGYHVRAEGEHRRRPVQQQELREAVTAACGLKNYEIHPILSKTNENLSKYIYFFLKIHEKL